MVWCSISSALTASPLGRISTATRQPVQPAAFSSFVGRNVLIPGCPLPSFVLGHFHLCNPLFIIAQQIPGAGLQFSGTGLEHCHQKIFSFPLGIHRLHLVLQSRILPLLIGHPNLNHFRLIVSNNFHILASFVVRIPSFPCIIPPPLSGSKKGVGRFPKMRNRLPRGSRPWLSKLPCGLICRPGVCFTVVNHGMVGHSPGKL